MRFADFDNDGINDIISVRGNNPTTDITRVYHNNYIRPDLLRQIDNGRAERPDSQIQLSMLHEGVSVVEPVILVRWFPATRLLECALGIIGMCAFLFDGPQKIECFRLTLRVGKRLENFGGAAVLAGLQTRESQVVAHLVGLRKRTARPLQ